MSESNLYGSHSPPNSRLKCEIAVSTRAIFHIAALVFPVGDGSVDDFCSFIPVAFAELVVFQVKQALALNW
jgi:hypothetical protein